MGKRILVIGATGLLGEPVARHLRQHGFAVRLLVRDIANATDRLGDDYEMVKGDIFDPDSLDQALKGCFGVHINLSGEVEQPGVERVAAMAARRRLQRITYISGTSVAEENTWVPLIRGKFLAEKAIRDCGVGYTLFCPTWFMEVLPKFVRGTRAFVFGKQPNLYHLIAADDYARMVAASFDLEEAKNMRFIIHGPEGILFHDALKRYCSVFHPEIHNISTMPYWLATIIASIKGNREMKRVSDFMAAFEKIGERGDPSEANLMLGAPEITLDDWLERRKTT